MSCGIKSSGNWLVLLWWVIDLLISLRATPLQNSFTWFSKPTWWKDNEVLWFWYQLSAISIWCWLFHFQLNEEVLSHQRKFTTEVRRIDEMERRLQAIHCELVKDEVEIREVEDEPHYPAYHEIIDLEAHIEKCDTEVTELSENFSQLLENQKGFVEFKCVMEQAELFMAHETPILSNDDLEENHQLHFVTGIVDVEKFSGFERMLWRVSHGCIYIKQAAIEAPFKDLKNVRKPLCLWNVFLTTGFTNSRKRKSSRRRSLHFSKATSWNQRWRRSAKVTERRCFYVQTMLTREVKWWKG